jgi:hypothetical protein
MSNSNKVVFVLTVGHTGTLFLSKLLNKNLPNSKVYHERQSFGIHQPEISHMQEFNELGSTQNIREFWRRKFLLILEELKDCEIYVETSHILLKCGLIDNLLPCDCFNPYFIVLTRDPIKVLRSMHIRGDFLNYAGIWTWWLSPSYKRNLTSYPEIFKTEKFDHHFVRIWYLIEMNKRIKNYCNMIKAIGHPIITIDVEDLNNVDGVKKLINFLGYSPNEVILPKPSNTMEEEVIPYTEEDERKYLKHLNTL